MDECIKTYKDFEYVIISDGVAKLKRYTGNDTKVNIPTYITTQHIDNQCTHSKNHNIIAIGEHAFGKNITLEEITIPSEVTSIDKYCFKRCRSLKVITLYTHKLNYIGDGAFDGCNSLESFSIPDSVTCINPKVFKDCILLKDIKIPYSVTTIFGKAFYGCSSLESLTVLNNNITIKSRAFEKCDSLNKLYILSNGGGFSSRMFPRRKFKEVILLDGQ